MAAKTGSREIPAFQVDEGSDLPLWIQLKDRFAYLIASGYYKPDDQLPSVRRFAAETRISYNTVSKAYTALEREGYIVTKHGSGAYVRETDSGAVTDEIDFIAEDFITTCLEKGMDYEDIPKCVSRAIRKMRRDHEEKR